jgi:hypothetical protein
MSNVETVTIEQGLLGRVFNFGTLAIFNPVLNQDCLYLEDIPNPHKYAKILGAFRNRSRSGTFIRQSMPPAESD